MPTKEMVLEMMEQKVRVQSPAQALQKKMGKGQQIAQAQKTAVKAVP